MRFGKRLVLQVNFRCHTGYAHGNGKSIFHCQSQPQSWSIQVWCPSYVLLLLRGTQTAVNTSMFFYMKNGQVNSWLFVLLLNAESEAEEPGDEGSDGPAEESVVGHQCNANAPLIRSSSSSSSDPSTFQSILTPVLPGLIAVHLHKPVAWNCFQKSSSCCILQQILQCVF